MDFFRKYPVGNHRFIVSLGVVQLSFAKLTNLSHSIDYDTIVEGGRNSHVHTFTKPKQQQDTLILERGVTNTADTLILRNLGIKPGGRIKIPVVIMVLSTDGMQSGMPNKIYGFDQGVVVRWELGELNAMSGEILVEKFEIAHTGLEEL